MINRLQFTTNKPDTPPWFRLSITFAEREPGIKLALLLLATRRVFLFLAAFTDGRFFVFRFADFIMRLFVPKLKQWNSIQKPGYCGYWRR